ncbi:MAG: WD40 repeat domain-containing protein [Nannocystaceae bacterium]
MLLREVATPDPWSSLVDWAEISTRLLGRAARQVHRLEHAGPVVAFAATPDGRRIAAVSSEGLVRVWTIGGDTVASVDLPGAHGRFRLIDISRDGARVVAGGGVSEHGKAAPVWLWSVEGGLIGELRGHTGSVNDVAFRPDGLAAATASSDGTARVWDATNAAPMAEFKVPRRQTPDLWDDMASPWASVNRIAWRPDGQQLATGDVDGGVYEWTVGREKPTSTMRGHTRDVTALHYSADGERLVSGSSDDTMRIWVPATGALERTLELERGVEAVAFSPDRSRLATVSATPESALVWHLGFERAEPLKGTRWPVSVAFSDDGAYLVTADTNVAVVWRGSGFAWIDVLRGHDAHVFDARFTADGCILTAGHDGSVRVWQLDLGTRTSDTARLNGRAHSPDGARRLVGSGRDGEPVQEVEGDRILWGAPLGEIDVAAYSPDGETLALASHEGELMVLRGRTGELLQRWSLPDRIRIDTSALALRDDGTLAQLALLDVAVWDTNGQKIAALHQDGGADGATYYEGLAWSPDGAHLALTTNAHDVLLWRIGQPAPERSLRLVDQGESFLDRLGALAWSPDGTRLAIGSHGGYLFEYDVASLRPLARSHVDPLQELRYSPDGERLLFVDAVGADGTVPSVHDPATILDALWRTNRTCPDPADRERWLNLDPEAAARDHARCEAILACVLGGESAATCVR